jgi:hypothetical protein
MAERTEILSMFERGYEAQSGHEIDDVCWLDAALAMFAGSDPDPLDLSSPTMCFRCGVSFTTKYQFTYGIGINLQPYIPDPRKCCFPKCDRSPFKYSKGLRRYINNVHNTTSLYKCLVDGCRTDHIFKRRDNAQRHIRKQHPQVSARILGS